MDTTSIFRIETLLNWQTVLLCMGIFVIVYAIRLAIQCKWAGWKTHHLYNNLLLPLLPLAVGFGLAYSKKFPWPTLIAESFWARVLYSMVCGLMCGWVYARVRTFVQHSSAPQLAGIAPATEAGPVEPVKDAEVTLPVFETTSEPVVEPTKEEPKP